MNERYDGVAAEDVDPCTGFSTTHKAKLSFPTIVWNRNGRNSLSSESTSTAPPPHNPLDNEIEIPTRVGPSSEQNAEQQSKQKHWIGLVFTLLSAVTFSFNALICKLLTHLHPFNLGVWTFLLMTLFAGLLIIYQVKVKQDENVFAGICTPLLSTTGSDCGKWMVPFYLSIRALCGVSALILFFYAVKYLTVADALVIDASSPIFVYLMALIFLGEKFGVLPVITTLMAFAGATLIARPPFLTHQAEYDSNSLIGVILAFSAMISIATAIITLKHLENVHHGMINFTFGLWGTLQCTLMAWICGTLNIPTELVDILKIVSVAVLFYLGQAFITLGLQYQDAGVVGLLRTTEVVFIFIWQLVFLGDVPDVYSWCGALLILVGVVMILIRNWINTLPSTSRLRNSCKLLLY